jgi:hypothetical protein
MCTTDGEAWRKSAMVAFSCGAKSPRVATWRGTARGSFKTALPTKDCLVKRAANKQNAMTRVIDVQYDFRGRPESSFGMA